MSWDGTNQRSLTRTPRNEYTGGWSPDGRTLSFYAAATDGWRFFYTIQSYEGDGWTVEIK